VLAPGHDWPRPPSHRDLANTSISVFEFLLTAWESLQIFLRLLRAHFEGKFTASASSILMVVAAVIYFVSP
jgi:hypothetical protein